METKKWYRSKMLWTNVIGIVVIVVSTMTADEELAREIMAAEAGILAVVNLILRMFTNQGLER